MLKSPQDVGLRAEIHIERDKARRAARALSHGGQEVAPSPGIGAAPPAASSTGRVRPALPHIGTGASAQVLAALLGNGNTDTDGLKSALARLTAHNRAILDTGTGADTLLSALASQLCILETLWQRYTLEAVRATNTNCTKVPLHKIAFAALQAYQRTAVLIASALDARKIISTPGSDGAQD